MQPPRIISQNTQARYVCVCARVHVHILWAEYMHDHNAFRENNKI